MEYKFPIYPMAFKTHSLDNRIRMTLNSMLSLYTFDTIFQKCYLTILPLLIVALLNFESTLLWRFLLIFLKL